MIEIMRRTAICLFIALTLSPPARNRQGTGAGSGRRAAEK